jgi:deoxycytidine triphosphate deaminase/uncharacterized protein YdcH (DUF465 family)
MATILNDSEIRSLLGIIIKDGIEENIRPNSYVLRMGNKGEFLDSQKPFELGANSGKKGIRLPPGHSVGVSSIEEIDFSKETVDAIFPGHALHGFLSPTTDMSREGIQIASTQIDAGFHGTLNWTLTNSGAQERGYVYGDAIFRLTIFKLAKDEAPETFYNGYYQGQKGYARSNRKGAPIGMRESEWDAPYTDGGPEELLDRLMKSGYPWQAVATQLRKTDDQFSMVSSEYQSINESISEVINEQSAIKETIRDVKNEQLIIKSSIEGIRGDFNVETFRQSISDVMESTINKTVNEKIPEFYNWAIIRLMSVLAVLAGLVIAAFSSPPVMAFLNTYGSLVGLVIIVMAVVVILLNRNKGKRQ